MKNILNLLKQKTTWAGVITILTGLGVSLKPEMQEAIISIGMSLGGLLLVAYNEKHNEDNK